MRVHPGRAIEGGVPPRPSGSEAGDRRENGSSDITIRTYDPAREAAPLELLSAGLDWVDDDRHHGFFRWKHAMNPFGVSPAWVAMDGVRLVGLRIFLRWEFLHRGQRLRAVQAVDTVTHPAYQRRGIFSRLTLEAMEGLTAEGVDFIFNTPNTLSGQGYTKLGWEKLGRFNVSVLPRSLAALPRLARASGGAGRWSLPTDFGESALSVVAQQAALGRLLSSTTADHRIRTIRTAPFLAWRYGHEALGYRAVLAGGSVDEGVAFFRLRRRGPALEAAISDVLVPGGDSRVRRQLVRRILKGSGADVVVGLGTPGIQVPGRGPVVVWRGLRLQQMPPRREWGLGVADLELF